MLAILGRLRAARRLLPHPVGALAAAALAAALAVAGIVGIVAPAGFRAVPAAATTTTYAYGTDPLQTLDATVDPALDPTGTGAPWVAVVHGGSWAAGDKASIAATAAKFAGEGFQVVNVSYRLSYGSPGAAWPAEKTDVVAALQWTKAHAADLHLDPNRGAVYGFSAGAHLAVLAAVTTPGLVRAAVSVSGPLQPDRLRNDVYAGPTTDDELTLVMQTVALLQCGNYTWTTCASRWDSMRPSLYFDPADPPLYLMHGEADTAIPVVTATSTSYWAGQKGVERVLVTVPGLGHNEAVATDPARWPALVAWLKTKTA